MISESEFSLLYELIKYTDNEKLTQRKLADLLGISLGKVNLLVKNLVNQHYIEIVNENYNVSSAGMDAMKPYKVENAVIMAAGIHDISLAAYIQGPIIGMIVADYLLVRKRRMSLKSAYFMKEHNAYKFTGGFNLVGIGCLVVTFILALLIVYNPVSGVIKSNIFLITTGSGFTAICGGLLYYVASKTPLKKYMLKDREDLEIV